MTTLPEVVRQSDLVNQLVLNRTTLEELGRVEVLWMYPQAHRVLGFICKSGWLRANKYAFKLAQIGALGANGILTHGEPEATDTKKVQQLESFLGCEIWSDAGNQIGKVIDYLFDLQTGAITQYLFTSSGWSGIVGDVYQLPPAQIVSFGRKRILVAEAATASFKIYRAGIQQKLAKAGEILKEDYSQATQELRSIAQKAQAVTEQAKEQAQSLSKQAKEKARNLNEQLKVGTQTLVEQMKEQTHTWSEQVEESLETLNVQAQEVSEPKVEAEADSEATPAPTPANEQKLVDHPSDLKHSVLEDDDEPWI